MKIRPISFRDACAFVDAHHRHHRRPQGHKFSLCLKDGERIVGVVMAGRPVSRKQDDGITLEVTRLCTDGTPNAPSKLYAAVRRVAGAMGYETVVTKTLFREPGTSLLAVGWHMDAVSKGGSWCRKNRMREDKHPIEPKKCWSVKT